VKNAPPSGYGATGCGFNQQFPKAGEVAYVWAGMTGGGFGTLTVDFFRSTSDAQKCVSGAEYAIKAE
jgi:hypothetical protein